MSRSAFMAAPFGNLSQGKVSGDFLPKLYVDDEHFSTHLCVSFDCDLSSEELMKKSRNVLAEFDIESASYS